MVEKKLLVISSDMELFSSMEKAFAGKPLEVKLAPNSAESRRILTEFKPDAFLIDLHLPDGNGFAVFGALKRNLALKNKIFLICAEEKDASAIEQHRKLRKHAERYLIKPFSPETFYNALAPMLMLPLAETRREPQPPALEVQPLDLPEPEKFIFEGVESEKGGEEEVLDELDSLLGDIPENMLDNLVASKEADLSELDEMLGVESEHEEESYIEPITIREKKPEPVSKQAPYRSEDSDLLDTMKEIVDAELDAAVEETLVEDLKPDEIVSEDTVVRNMMQDELAGVLEDEASLDKIVEEALGNSSELDDEIVQAVLEDVEREVAQPVLAEKPEKQEPVGLDFDTEEFILPEEKPAQHSSEAREAAEGTFKAMLEKRLAEALENLDQERASLDMVRRQVAQLEEKFTFADSENRKLHRELTEKDEEMAAVQERLLHKDEELSNRTDVLNNRDAELVSLNSDLTEANKQLRQMEESLSSERSAKSQLETELQSVKAERDRELSESRAELEDVRRSLKESMAQVEEKCARMEHSCSTYEATRSEMAARLSEKEALCSRLESEMNDLRVERAEEVRRLEGKLLELERGHKEELDRLEKEHAREITEVRRQGDERISELGRSLDDALRQRNELSVKIAELEKRHAVMEEQYHSAGRASQDSDVRIGLLEAEAEELREINQKNEQRLVKAYALIKSEMKARTSAELKLKGVQDLLGLNK